MSSNFPSSPLEQKLENSVEIGTLCAFYGGLLTDKQREALQLHYGEDLSLGEIAEQLGVSRQSVHDLITRSAEKLRAYEAALGAAERMEALRQAMGQAMALLRQAQGEALPETARRLVAQAEALLQTIMQQQEENAYGL